MTRNSDLLMLAYTAIDRLLLGLDVSYDALCARGGYTEKEWSASTKYARKVLEKLRNEIKS